MINMIVGNLMSRQNKLVPNQAKATITIYVLTIKQIRK